MYYSLFENINYLRTFITKADELSHYTYFEKGTSIISFTTGVDENGNQFINFNYPNLEQKKALLLTLRMFWQRNDSIYYRKFLDFYLSMPFSQKWKLEVQDILFVLDMQLDSWAFEGKERLTCKELFKIFLYGDEGHLRKRKKYLKLVETEELRKLNESTFHKTILDFSIAIISLANISRRELLRLGISYKEFN
ncbi:MAG: hypothetical protein ABFD07_09170 [Methanobacterium sp.]